MQTPSIPSPAKVAALEKVPHAAKRMGLSTCSAYREIKAGRLGPLSKWVSVHRPCRLLRSTPGFRQKSTRRKGRQSEPPDRLYGKRCRAHAAQ